jgi:large subunit ribosomal protein L13
MITRTFSPKPADLSHDWYLVDADGKTLGRLATQLAGLIMGKGKPGYSAHADGGDNVVVINAAKITVTGNKLEAKHYHRHSGYPGGLTSISLATQLAKDPTRVIEQAVAGMLPKNRLQAVRLERLKLYAGPEHPHAGQTPKPIGDK